MPKIQSVLVACLLVCSFPALADQVVLKNGDRVSGSIVKKDGKNLTIKSDSFGVITTAWDQVDSIRTDKPVNVVLQDGRTAQGTLATTEGKVQVSAPAAPLSVALADITTIRDADEQKAYERLSLTQQLREQANLALELAQARYKLGLGSIVEFSQAELQETDAELQDTDAHYQYLVTQIVLAYQMGITR